MRVEVYDSEGNRYTITLEGRITRDKAVRILDLIELLGGIPMETPPLTSSLGKLSKIDKVRLIIEKHFPLVWFSSKDIRTFYEREFKEPISASTVSTYLSRLARRGFLIVSAESNVRRYRMVTEITQDALRLITAAKK